MSKLDKSLSLITILQEEESLNYIHNAFFSTCIWDNSEGIYISVPADADSYFDEEEDDISDLLQIIQAPERHILERLYICSKYKTQDYKQILKHYQELFPLTKNFLLEYSEERVELTGMEYYTGNNILSGSNSTLIPVNSISSGMLRTLYFLAYLHLSPKGTIMLIDEFENGFGINCIGALAHEMLMQQDKIQFVVTSHHPYIINTIPHQNWKIVTRKQTDNMNYISVHQSDELDVESSHHEKYMQLINSPLFTEGIG
jgi:hypothetical protein